MPISRAARPAVLTGTALGLGLITLIVVVLVPFRDHVGATTPALLLTIAAGAAAAVGGSATAVIVSVAAAAALDLAFLRPYGALDVLALEDTVALGSFLAVAGSVGFLVASQRDRRLEAEHRERELRELAERLEALTDERARLLVQAARADDLARVDDQRRAVLRSVSHDLRTPLSAIRAVVSDLRDGVVYDEATKVELLTLVSDEIDRLDRLVANLLSLSRIEAGAFAPDRQAVDVQELILDRLRRLSPLFRDVHVRTKLPDDLPLVDGDYGQLEQLMTNLLANLARHAPTGTDVWVIARRRDSMVDIEVSDRGKGIPESEHERIFEPFQRGEGSASSGVGLAICKAIVDGHGGTIRVERTFGGGATFIVSLPAHPGVVSA
jgi:K+-sensing histidine kinase KdpD